VKRWIISAATDVTLYAAVLTLIQNNYVSLAHDWARVHFKLRFLYINTKSTSLYRGTVCLSSLLERIRIK